MPSSIVIRQSTHLVVSFSIITFIGLFLTVVMTTQLFNPAYVAKYPVLTAQLTPIGFGLFVLISGIGFLDQTIRTLTVQGTRVTIDIGKIYRHTTKFDTADIESVSVGVYPSRLPTSTGYYLVFFDKHGKRARFDLNFYRKSDRHKLVPLLDELFTRPDLRVDKPASNALYQVLRPEDADRILSHHND